MGPQRVEQQIPLQKWVRPWSGNQKTNNSDSNCRMRCHTWNSDEYGDQIPLNIKELIDYPRQHNNQKISTHI